MNEATLAAELNRRLSPGMLSAIDELEAIILARYPGTVFNVEAAFDDPFAVYLVATGNFPDHDSVIDLVIDRQMELMIDDELPIFVIPLIRPATHAGAAG